MATHGWPPAMASHGQPLTSQPWVPPGADGQILAGAEGSWQVFTQMSGADENDAGQPKPATARQGRPRQAMAGHGTAHSNAGHPGPIQAGEKPAETGQQLVRRPPSLRSPSHPTAALPASTTVPTTSLYLPAAPAPTAAANDNARPPTNLADQLAAGQGGRSSPPPQPGNYGRTQGPTGQGVPRRDSRYHRTPTSEPGGPRAPQASARSPEPCERPPDERLENQAWAPGRSQIGFAQASLRGRRRRGAGVEKPEIAVPNAL